MSGRWWAPLAVAMAVGSCGGGPAAPEEVEYQFSFDDAAGDTTTAAPAGNPDQVKAIDLVKVSGEVTPDRVLVVLEFAEPVTRWTERAPNGLDGFLFFDVDQARSSGIGNDLHEVGADVYVDLRDNGAGRVGLVGVAGRTLDLVSLKVDGARVEIEIPRPLLRQGSDLDNRLNLWVSIGARRRTPVADEGPNTSHYVLEPPDEG